MTVTTSSDLPVPSRFPWTLRPLPSRSAGRVPSDAPKAAWASWVDSARVRLEEQHAFRSKQLEELSDLEPSAAAGAGPHEVWEALRAAAHAALFDVEAALMRIEQGSYGRCPTCGDSISLQRLDAVPSAPLCAACHHRSDNESRPAARG